MDVYWCILMNIGTQMVNFNCLYRMKFKSSLFWVAPSAGAGPVPRRCEPSRVVKDAQCVGIAMEDEVLPDNVMADPRRQWDAEEKVMMQMDTEAVAPTRRFFGQQSITSVRNAHECINQKKNTRTHVLWLNNRMQRHVHTAQDRCTVCMKAQ